MIIGMPALSHRLAPSKQMPVPFDCPLSVFALVFTMGVSHVFEELADDLGLGLVEPRNALEKPMLRLTGAIVLREPLCVGPLGIRRTRQREPPDHDDGGNIRSVIIHDQNNHECRQIKAETLRAQESQSLPQVVEAFEGKIAPVAPLQGVLGPLAVPAAVVATVVSNNVLVAGIRHPAECFVDAEL